MARTRKRPRARAFSTSVFDGRERMRVMNQLVEAFIGMSADNRELVRNFFKALT